MTGRFTRREALSLTTALFLPEMSPIGDTPPLTLADIDWPAEIAKAHQEWPDEFSHGPLGELCQDLARMELHALQENYPRTWERYRYSDCINFHRGATLDEAVALLFGVGSRQQVDADLQGAYLGCMDAGVVGIALAFGDDSRSWVMMAAATKEQALEAAAGRWGPQTKPEWEGGEV